MYAAKIEAITPINIPFRALFTISVHIDPRSPSADPLRPIARLRYVLLTVLSLRTVTRAGRVSHRGLDS